MAVKTQDEMDQIIAARGGGTLVHGVAGQKRILNPKYRPSDMRSTEPEFLTIDVEQWKSPEGHTIQAIHLPDGTWDVSQDEPPTPKPAAATAAKPAGGKEDIEGTPDPSKPAGVDNERPRKVIRDAAGNEVWSGPLNKTEMDEWRESRERSRNPGGKTDADLEREQKEAEARAARPGTKIRERIEIRGGKKVTIETWRLPDGTFEDRTSEQLAAASERPGRIEIQYQHDDGKTYTQVTETDPATNLTRKYFVDPATGKEVTLPPKGQLKLPPGAPPLDLSSPEAAYSTTLRYQQWLDAKFRAGELTGAQVTEAFAPAHTAAQMVINKAKEERSQKQQEVSNLLTQRQQDISRSGTALTNSTSQFAEANRTAQEVGKLADPGMNATTNTLFGTMALQRLFANQMGGFNESPQVVVPGPVSSLPTYPGTPAAPATTVAGSPSGAEVAVQNAATQAGSRQAFGALGVPPIGTPAPPVAPRMVAPPITAAPAPAGSAAAPLSPADATHRTEGTMIVIRNRRTGWRGRIPLSTFTAYPLAAQAEFEVEDPSGSGTVTPGASPAVPAATAPAPPPDSTPFPSQYGGGGDVQMAPTYGMPTMALASSFSGQGAYDPAVASLKRLGFTDDDIDRAMQAHVGGAA